MIITCEKCATRFRLDKSLLQIEGSRVRCSLCKHVFTAFPPLTHAADSGARSPSDPDGLSAPPQEKVTESRDPETEDVTSDAPGFDDTGVEAENEKTIDTDAPDRFTPSRDVPPPPRRPARASLIQPLDPEGSLTGFAEPSSRKKSVLKVPALVLVLIFFLAAGGYIAAGSLGYKIPFLPAIQIQQYLPQKASEPLPAPDPVPDQKTVTGRFLTNDTAGELFIITGRIENPSQVPYRRIQVKGTLFQKEKTAAITQTAICGNVVPEAVLKTGTISDILDQLQSPREMTDINAVVMPGSSVPFMLVFSDLPHNLENFTVEVVGFEKTDP
jgi:predicted Zn finger-like uncharacterized protein